MRGYKISKDGLIEDIYDLAPEGSKDKYNGVAGDYTETAINKLIAQNVRYREFIEVKADKRRIEVDLQDTQDELKRLIGEDKQNKETIEDLHSVVESKKRLLIENQERAEQLQKDLIDIKSGIDSVLGGVE